MPVDEKILKQTEIQKVKQRYQHVNKNEVKFRGKIPANIEYENNKQKMQILIIERNDITRYQSIGEETSDRKVPRFI